MDAFLHVRCARSVFTATSIGGHELFRVKSSGRERERERRGSAEIYKAHLPELRCISHFFSRCSARRVYVDIDAEERQTEVRKFGMKNFEAGMGGYSSLIIPSIPGDTRRYFTGWGVILRLCIFEIYGAA